MSEPHRSKMLISREKSAYKLIDTHKTAKGQFFTTRAHWLTAPVREFIAAAAPACFLDPFAGEGHLLHVCQAEFSLPIHGLDLQSSHWPHNDSLRDIPSQPGALIVTNPPYLAKHSARRKGVYERVADYYAQHDDLYQLALARCFAAARHTVAIIPETFLNADFPKQHLVCAVVLEDNPFDDTETPVCVACFDTEVRDGQDSALLYVNEHGCGRYGELFRLRRRSVKNRAITFNAPHGNLALRAVDSTDPARPIAFSLPDRFDYARSNIKTSSRLLTYIQIDGLPPDALPALVEAANHHLQTLRQQSHDLILSPFKGNNREGKRRRRLDYRLARGILEEVLGDGVGGDSSPKI